MFTMESKTLNDTLAIGQRIGENLAGGEIIALTGDLGAGKTVLVKGIALGLGIADVITSPTFVLVKSYAGRLPLHHMDFYRLDSPRDLDTIGFDDYLESGGVLAIEWAEKFPDRIPHPRIWITISWNGEDERFLTVAIEDDPALGSDPPIMSL